VGTGEKPDDLEPFHPDRMAGRILGMGDVLTLIDKAQEKLDTAEAQKTAENMLKGQFTFEDFLDQLRQVQKLGSMGDILKMLPGVPGGRNAMKEMAAAVDEGELKRAEAMILSMTPAERREPGIISGSRRLRIANGSGVTTADVNSLLKDFESAKKMMRTMMGGNRVPGMMKVPSAKLPRR
jgi:signal recognition particle subunit SRP54